MAFTIAQLAQWRAPLLAARQRRLLLWQGDRARGLQLGQQLATELPRHLLLSDQSVAGAQPVTAGKRWLGHELDLVVLDGWAGFDPESFGALSGTLVAGGLLLLIVPPNWCHYPDPDYQRITPWPHTVGGVAGRFLGRIEALLGNDCAVLHWKDPQRLPELPDHLTPLPQPVADESGALTVDQARAVQALLQARTPQVLVADRGRGKSAALGLVIAAALKSTTDIRIIVTAPRKRAVAGALALARARLGLFADAPLQSATGRCDFIAPDQLLGSDERADLILVDEAAALPVPILTALLKRQLAAGGQIAFATTLHGYEGTGRGFAVRFRKTLNRLAPDWQQHRLKAPIRWAEDDPLERFSFKALLLDAEPEQPPEPVSGAVLPLEVELLERDRLALDEPLLRALFGLLVQAHYQTSPNDLRQLLDSPGQSVWVVRVAGVVIATALVTEEGGFTPELSRAIWAGQRRPRGHLLAQSLAAHGGWLLAPRQRGMRIMRIAVAESWQRRGVGQRLVQAIEQHARQQGVDWLGSSFAASADLVGFWHGLGLEPVRLGVARDASSGSYALNVLKGLSGRGKSLAKAAFARFAGHWPPLSQQLDRALEDELGRIVACAPEPRFYSRQHWLDLLAFARGRRAFETIEAQLIALAPELVPQNLREAQLLQLKLVARSAWPAVAKEAGFNGQKAAQQALRDLLSRYLESRLPKRWNPLLRIVE